MIKSAISICIFIMILFFSKIAYAQDFLNNQVAYFETIEKYIKQNVQNSTKEHIDKINDFKENLHVLQKQAQSDLLEYQAEKKEQQNLLDILGPAPEKKQDQQETSQVVRIRKGLNKKLSIIDGKIKKSQLIIAQSEQLIKEITALNLEQLQSKLSERLPSPFMPHVIISAFQQGLKLFQKKYNDVLSLSIVACFILLNFLSIPIINFLNNRRKNFIYASFQPISHRLVIQLVIASTIIMVLRYGDFSVAQYNELVHLSQAISAIILSISLYEILGKVRFANTSNAELSGYIAPFWKFLLHKVSWGVLIFIPLTIIGFTEFSAYFVFNIFTVILAILFFIVMRMLVVNALSRIENYSNITEKNKFNQISSASTTLIIEPLIAVLTSFFALFFWGYDYTDFQLWVEKYANGIPVGKLMINFQDLWAAIASFGFIYFSFKLMKWFLSSRIFPKTNLDTGIANTILTILGYVGIILAVVSAAAALGLDASNVALVAGALSVGIGFGLQAIFSNFVSGLILLFERPFKVGDWVKVNEFEGIIQKISVRSTEIQTFQRSSVIVPNAQLISDVVTNRSLHSEHSRIEIPVGVAYGSPIDKVKTVLLECAKECKKVLNYPEPIVLFMNFGDSSLDFELRFHIATVHSSLSISSDIRFLIDQKFRENNIEIPFPQHDLHIRSTVIPST